MCRASLFVGARTYETVVDVLPMLVGVVLVLSAAVAGDLRDGICNLLVHSVALGDRLPARLIPRGFPPLGLLKRLRKQERRAVALTVEYGPETREAYMNRYHNMLLWLPAWAAEADRQAHPRR